MPACQWLLDSVNEVMVIRNKDKQTVIGINQDSTFKLFSLINYSKFSDIIGIHKHLRIMLAF